MRCKCKHQQSHSACSLSHLSQRAAFGCYRHGLRAYKCAYTHVYSLSLSLSRARARARLPPACARAHFLRCRARREMLHPGHHVGIGVQRLANVCKAKTWSCFMLALLFRLRPSDHLPPKPPSSTPATNWMSASPSDPNPRGQPAPPRFARDGWRSSPPPPV